LMGDCGMGAVDFSVAPSGACFAGRARATVAPNDVDHTPSASSPSTASAIAIEAELASIDPLTPTTTSHASRRMGVLRAENAPTEGKRQGQIVI